MQHPTRGQEPDHSGSKSGPSEGSAGEMLTVFKERAKLFFAEYAQNVLSIVTQPGVFFAQMPREGGFKDPGAFVAVGAVVNALMLSLFHQAPFGPIGHLVFTAVLLLFASFASLKLAQKLGVAASFEVNFRVVSYCCVTLLLAWLRQLGLIYVIGTCYLLYEGFSKAYDLPMPKAMALAAVAVLIVSFAASW